MELEGGTTYVYRDPVIDTCYYLIDNSSSPMYYMAFKLWSTSVLAIPEDENDTDESKRSITDKTNGMVYISTNNISTDYKDKHALIITCLTTISNPEMKLLGAHVEKDGDKLLKVGTNESTVNSVRILDIGGSYYTTWSTVGSLYGNNCLDYDMSGYIPSNWKPWDEVKSKFK
jgi:hypothetical protein